jgi:hypothetical protein
VRPAPPAETSAPPARPEPAPAPRLPDPKTDPKTEPKPEPKPEPKADRPSAAAQSEDDEAAIRRLIATYGHAIEAKDLALFRTIKPNLSGAEERRLRDGFRDVASQRVALTVLSVTRHGEEATVALRRRDTIQAGGRQQTVESHQTLRVSRVNGSWVITDIR